MLRRDVDYQSEIVGWTRVDAAPGFAKAITEKLAGLGMPSATMEVTVTGTAGDDVINGDGGS